MEGGVYRICIGVCIYITDTIKEKQPAGLIFPNFQRLPSGVYFLQLNFGRGERERERESKPTFEDKELDLAASASNELLLTN